MRVWRTLKEDMLRMLCEDIVKTLYEEIVRRLKTLCGDIVRRHSFADTLLMSSSAAEDNE